MFSRFCGSELVLNPLERGEFLLVRELTDLQQTERFGDALRCRATSEKRSTITKGTETQKHTQKERTQREEKPLLR